MLMTDYVDLSFLHYFYLGTSKFYVGTGPGMPECSYTTARLVIRSRNVHDNLIFKAMMMHLLP